MVRGNRKILLLALAAVACGDGGAAGPDPQVHEPLLSDSALHQPLQPDAPAVEAAWAEWIQLNHHPVRSLTSTDFADLQFLKPLIGNRRLVQLGESSHGSREFNQSKVRLIQFLHQEMGFDVVAFEAGFPECYQADRRLREDHPASTLRSCLFRVWHTAEVQQLFAYMRNQTGPPLTLAGFDVQASGEVPRWHRLRLLRDVLQPYDAELGQRIMFLDSIFVVHMLHPELDGIIEMYGDSMIGQHQKAIGLIEANAGAISSRYPAQPEIPLVAAQTSRAQIAYINAMRSEPGSQVHRDRGMADNITFLLEQMYPGRKIIVWAHNAHIQHDSPAIPFLATAVMGHELVQRHRNELYTIGLFMGAGASAANDRSAVPVARPPEHGIEAVMMRAERRFSFVNLLGAPVAAGTSWMDQPVGALHWGAQPYTMVPRNQFDGILYIHESGLPYYLP